MADMILVNGVWPKEKKWPSGDTYVSAGIKVEEFIKFMNEHVTPSGYINIDFKTSRGGKMYAALDTWKPTGGAAAMDKPAPQDKPEDDIPF